MQYAQNMYFVNSGQPAAVNVCKTNVLQKVTQHGPHITADDTIEDASIERESLFSERYIFREIKYTITV